jgi:hypothetical protein
MSKVARHHAIDRDTCPHRSSHSTGPRGPENRGILVRPLETNGKAGSARFGRALKSHVYCANASCCAFGERQAATGCEIDETSSMYGDSIDVRE